jgi:hypothetical protein
MSAHFQRSQLAARLPVMVASESKKTPYRLPAKLDFRIGSWK